MKWDRGYISDVGPRHAVREHTPLNQRALHTQETPIRRASHRAVCVYCMCTGMHVMCAYAFATNENSAGSFPSSRSRPLGCQTARLWGNAAAPRGLKNVLVCRSGPGFGPWSWFVCPGGLGLVGVCCVVSGPRLCEFRTWPSFVALAPGR